MTKKQSTAATFKPLTDAQYARWARLAQVSETAVRIYHGDTGKAPQPGFRRINCWQDFPGLQQLHAWMEIMGAEAEAFVASSKASTQVEEALSKWQAAKQLHDSLKTAHAETREAYKRLAGVAQPAAGECRNQSSAPRA